MVFRVYMLAVKNPALSLDEFKYRWDIQHINLLKEVAGDAYPAVHVHRYPSQVPMGAGDAGGTRYDGIGYLEFGDRAAWLRLNAIIAETPGARARLDADEREVFDVAKFQMYTVDDEEVVD